MAHSKISKLILVKDRLKVRAEAFAENELSLHSFENKPGVIISKDLIEEFSRVCSESGNKIIKEISFRIHSNRFRSLPLDSVEVLVRRSIFPLIHFYWNQVMRIQLLVSKKKGLSVYQAKDQNNEIQTPEEFERKVLSPEFNEFFVFFLAEIWKLEVTEENTPASGLNLSNLTPGKNNLFSLGKFVRLRNKLIRYAEKVFMKLYPFSRFPVLTFANSETALRMKGMYLFHFRLLNSKWQLPEVKKDIPFRNQVFGKEFVFDKNFSKFFQSIGVSKEQFESSIDLFKRYLIQYFPIQFLEGLALNFQSASSCFLKNDNKAILSSGDGDSFSTYSIAYAKGNGFKVIKAQHGGHYGYYKDNRPALDIELPATDVFFTWGWTKMHEGSQLNHIHCVPMPSPWLSERKRYWMEYKISSGKKYDILWMPQMMKRFVGAPQGASSVRRDIITEFSNSMLDIAKEIRKNHLNTFMKPYNALTVALMEETYEKVQEEGDRYLTISKTYDKGLTIDLLKDCSIVLWDQPGTGFLECMSGGIPTLVFWDRLYCEEEEWTKEDFGILEKYGIIHRSVPSLISEALVLLRNSKAWMDEPSRKSAIASFCQKYALTSKHWNKDWVSYLKSLK